MTDSYVEIIRSASSALEPMPTGLTPKLPKLTSIRAVMFDIYGTLLVSASGDIGAADPTLRGEAFAEAINAIGGNLTGDATSGAAEIRAEIESHHERARGDGVRFPEVNIVEVWRESCQSLIERGLLQIPEKADWARLAIEFEVRVNPVWPMPRLGECMVELRRVGAVMGIISNAQFFTPLAVHAVVGKSLDQLGFSPDLRYYSYEHRRAKPGPELYNRAAAALADQQMEPQEVLFVGNDMRNDIWPAAAVGFRTALFAGDRRSLRLREDDQSFTPQCEPDARVTDLSQIPSLVQPQADREERI